jgi:hypothetical protein
VNVGQESTEPGLPRWFTACLTAVLVFVGTAGLSGIALLVVHRYHPLTVWALAAGAALAGAVAVARRSKNGSVVAPHGPALAAVGVALIFFAITGVLHSEHLMTDRDPGVYVNTGRSIAGQHTLTPTVRAGPFEDPKFVVSSPGFDEVSGKQQTWFLPMLPVLLALGWSAGGYTGLFAVGPLLGALGLLVCYALSARLVGPRWAVLAPVLLAINPLQTWFARDAYSELVVQGLALGGIWMYLEARANLSPRFAAVSGALVATSVLARFDALAIVAALVGFSALEWTRRLDGERHNARRQVVAAFAIVLLAVTIYCSLIAHTTSSGYLDAHRNFTRSLYIGLAGAVVLGTIWIVAHRLRPGFGRRLARAHLPFAIGCAFVTSACIWAYVWRPANPADAFSLGDILTPPPNPAGWLRAQWSWSMRWFVEWFGISAVLLALFGFLILCRRALRGNVAATAVVMVVSPLAVIFIWRPDVAPDQPWAMRRFLPIVIPGLVIAVSVVMHSLTSAARRIRARRQRLLAYFVVFALIGGAIAPSAIAAAPLAGARAQHGAFAAVRRLCAELPSDAVVLIFPASYLDNEMTQTVRGFCEVPTARAPTEPDLDIASLARAWNKAHRSLYIVTASPEKIRKPTRANVAVVVHLEIDDRYAPQYTYRVRPSRYVPHPRQLWLLRVDPIPVAP